MRIKYIMAFELITIFCVCNFNAIINANGNTIELTTYRVTARSHGLKDYEEVDFRDGVLDFCETTDLVFETLV